MTIVELIKALEELKEKHGGDVDVTVFQYGGGLDDLCDVQPVFEEEYGLVVFDTTCHGSGVRR